MFGIFWNITYTFVNWINNLLDEYSPLQIVAGTIIAFAVLQKAYQLYQKKTEPKVLPLAQLTKEEKEAQLELESQKDHFEIAKKNAEEVNTLYSEIIANKFSSQDLRERLNDEKSCIDDYLKAWEEKHAAFHQAHHAAMKHKQNVFMISTHLDLYKKVVEHLSNPDLSIQSREKISKQFSKLRNIFTTWYKSKDALGEGVHPKAQRDRVYSYDSYFTNAISLMKQIQPTSGSDKQDSPNMLTRLGAGIRGAATLSNIVFQLFARNILSRIPNPFKNSINSTPLNSDYSSNGFFKAYADWYGVKIKVEGKEHLDLLSLNADPNKKVVNFFLPEHQNAIIDPMVTAQLGLPHFAIFLNPNSVCPGPITGNLLASAPEIIAVGERKGCRGLNPTEKVLATIESKCTSNIVNYPQGIVDLRGLPINGEFVNKLIKPLIDKGYEVNITPVSHNALSPALTGTANLNNLQVTAKIHPPLLHHAVKKLVEKEQSDGAHFLNRYICAAWHEGNSNELSLVELMRRREQVLGLRPNSSKTLACA